MLLHEAADVQVVLGSDVLYEPYQAAALAATLQQRIAPGGLAMLCCPVREQVWQFIRMFKCKLLTSPATAWQLPSLHFCGTLQRILQLSFCKSLVARLSSMSDFRAACIRTEWKSCCQHCLALLNDSFTCAHRRCTMPSYRRPHPTGWRSELRKWCPSIAISASQIRHAATRWVSGPARPTRRALNATVWLSMMVT
jgi:hypothetical protein